jgi:hypothetical protein
MDHRLGKLCQLPCFTLVVSLYALVLCCHCPRKRSTTSLTRSTTRGPHKGNVLFPTILNTFHHGASHSVLKFGNGSWSILSREEGVECPEVDLDALFIYVTAKW